MKRRFGMRNRLTRWGWYGAQEPSLGHAWGRSRQVAKSPSLHGFNDYGRATSIHAVSAVCLARSFKTIVIRYLFSLTIDRTAWVQVGRY